MVEGEEEKKSKRNVERRREEKNKVIGKEIETESDGGKERKGDRKKREGEKGK